MPDEVKTPATATTETEAAPTPNYLTAEQFNAAATAREKRLLDTISKTLETRLAALTPATPAQAAPATPVEGQAQKADPKLLEMQARIEALDARAKAAEQQKAEAETASAKAEMRRTVLAALDGKGIKGVKARAIVHDLEATGSLKLDESGKPVLKVTRARTKGAKADALEFDDLDAGMGDWSQTPEAAEFLPAPTNPKNNSTQRRGGALPPIDPNADPTETALARAQARLDRAQ